MSRILERALKQVKDAEVYSVRVEKYPVNFSGNKLKSIKSQLTRGVGLRVNYGGKLGFSSESGEGDPDSLVSRAISSAKLGTELQYRFYKDESVTSVDIFDPRTVSFEIEEAVEMGNKIIEQVTKKAPETVNDLSITKYFIEVTYASEGVEKTYYKTAVSRSLSCMQVTDEGFIYISEGDSSCKVPDDTLSLARRVLSKIPLTKNSYEMPSKPTTVIFHPKAVYNLVSSLKAGLSGSNLVSGTSPLLGKLNKIVLDQRFSMADDPTIALESGSEWFDGEGLPRRRVVLFDRGVLNDYLLDQTSARKLGLSPNACAGRSSDAPPSPGSSNIIISGGSIPASEMIEGVADGLLVEEVIGGGQSNVIAGEFSTNVSLGFRIKNGELTGRVRNTMIAGNVYDLLSENLLAMSVETENHYSITAPYMMFRNVSVSGKN
jgi:PmbA protein